MPDNVFANTICDLKTDFLIGWPCCLQQTINLLSCTDDSYARYRLRAVATIVAHEYSRIRMIYYYNIMNLRHAND
jgi:hypothetical protein